MKSKGKSSIVLTIILSTLLIASLLPNIILAQETIPGTPNDTPGVWLYSAGTTVPAGAPTDDIIKRAIDYDILDYIGDTPQEVYAFSYGPSEPYPGYEDTTLAEVMEGLSAIDDFGYIAYTTDDFANFDTGRNGYFLGGFDPATQLTIHPDGIPATGTLGPSQAPTIEEAIAALDGCELFIFEDAELSGMFITLSNTLGLTIIIDIEDLQVDPPTPYGADDTLIAIDLDTLEGFDGTFIDTIQVQDDGITSPSTWGDTTLEIDAIAIRKIECPVTFYTDPSDIGSITFEGDIYFNGDSDTFMYGTSGLATANVPEGWLFDHWEATGNVELSSTTDNPTTVTVVCGGTLKAVFTQEECPVTFYTDPSDIGSITFEGDIYFNADSDTFPYGTSGEATANVPAGWVFDHWEATGNVELSSTTDNPTTVTVVCGGTLKAVFRQVECPVTFYTDPSDIGSITFEGDIYFDSDSDTFPYGTSGLATANIPEGWDFDHWEATGNVELSSTTDNPTTVTVLCGGTLKAVYVQILCPVDFYTDPSYIGSITFEGDIYFDGDSDTFPYETSGLATANVPAGWLFDHWEATGNVHLSSTTDNPTTVTVLCGGALKAYFIQIQCPVDFYTDPSDIGSITFEGDIYFDGDSDTFPYGTSGEATANVPAGWLFDHWEATGNVELSSTTDNPTTVTVVCGGTLKAVFIQEECPVTFYTDPSKIGSITFEGDIYFDGDSDTFPYETSGLATANVPAGWLFDHWEATGNVHLSSTTDNPTTVTVLCGGILKAVYVQIMCPVTFYTDPSDIGSITFEGDIYFDSDSDTFPYGTSGLATANVPAGWVFDHWEATGNVELSSTTDNPTTVTVLCGGTLKAVYKPVECEVYFYTDPSDVGNITIDDKTYLNGESDTWDYCTTLTAIANAPVGYVFDRWEVTGNLDVLEEIENTIRFHIACGGTVKAYFSPIARAKITGGGHGDIGANGIPGGSFGFNVMWFSKDPGPKGELEYVDHTTGMKVHAHVIEYLSVWEFLVGNKPWPLRKGIFGGPCTIDGEDGYTFEVYIEDYGEPGRNDVFQITLSTGYVGGSDVEPILCGNIQIHRSPK